MIVLTILTATPARDFLPMGSSPARFDAGLGFDGGAASVSAIYGSVLLILKILHDLQCHHQPYPSLFFFFWEGGGF